MSDYIPPYKRRYLTPDDIPSGVFCRQVVMPDSPEWVGLVSGVLSELMNPDTWRKHGSLTPEQAAEQWASIVYEFWDSDCATGTCPRIYRTGVGGLIELSDDGGETWHSAAEEIPVPEPRPEPTTPDKLCVGSANAENVLHQTYVELLDAYATDSSTQYGIGAFLAVFGLAVSAWLGAPLLIINGLIALALDAFATVYGLGLELATDEWTEETTESLICLLQRHASIDGEGAIRFDYQAVRDNLSELNASPNVILWLFYILWIIGSEALDAAGATTAIEAWDCDNCGGTWQVDITPDNIENMQNARYEWTWRAAYTCSDLLALSGRYAGSVQQVNGINVWRTTLAPDAGRIYILWRLFIPLGSTVTGIRIYWDQEGGAINPTIRRVRFGSDEQCNPSAAVNYWASGVISETGVLYDVEAQIVFGTVGRMGNIPLIRIDGTGINPFV